MHKKATILLTIIIMLITFTGCGINNNSISDKKAKILFSVSNASDGFCSKLVENANIYANKHNINLTIRDAAGSIENQISHMKEASADKYDAIICAAVNPDTALQIERVAHGIPIVFINSEPGEKLLYKGKYIYVASNEKVAGQYQANYVINYLKNKKNVNVVLIKGEKDHNATKGRTKAVKTIFKKRGINAKYVFEDNADWNKETAKDMFNVFLSTHKKFDCVITNNDFMALGVVAACKENKIDPSSFPIVGIDALNDACKAISDGSMKLTVYQNAKGQSEYAMKAAVNLASDAGMSNIKYATKDGKYIWVPFEKVDKSNVNRYME